MNIINLIGREKELFEQDIANYEGQLQNIIGQSGFLVLGGAGTIGQAVTKEIFKRNPLKLHVVDISENNKTPRTYRLSGSAVKKHQPSRRQAQRS